MADCAFCAQKLTLGPLCRAAANGDLAALHRIRDSLAWDSENTPKKIEAAMQLAAAGNHLRVLLWFRNQYVSDRLRNCRTEWWGYSALEHAIHHGALGSMALIGKWFEFSGEPPKDLAKIAVSANRPEALELFMSWVLSSVGYYQHYSNAILGMAATHGNRRIMRLMTEQFQASPRCVAPSDIQAAAVLNAWEGALNRERHHRCLVHAAIALSPLDLPLYALLWLLEWVMVPTGDLKRQGAYVPPNQHGEPCLTEYHRLRSLERVVSACRRRHCKLEQ